MSEAKGADYQRRNPLPPADTVGVVTVAGRNLHASIGLSRLQAGDSQHG